MSRAFRLALMFGIFALYCIAAPFGYGGFALIQLLPTPDPARRARRLKGVMRWFFRLLHDLLRWSRLLDFNARHLGGQLPEGPAVLVANHPGLLDITALMASIDGVTTAVKPVLFRKRWWRPALEGALLFEGASDALEAGHVISSGVERLRDGFRVLIFPEGTRSPQGRLHRFGRTAFEIACRANVPIVPITIECEPAWLSKQQPLLMLPVPTPRMRVTAHCAIHPADHGFSSRKLRDVVEAHVRSRLGVTAVQAGGQRNGTDPARIARGATEETHRGVADAGGCQAR